MQFMVVMEENLYAMKVSNKCDYKRLTKQNIAK